MGTPDFAVPSLQALLDAGHEVAAVYTQPDKPQGRKQILTAPPVKEVALAHGIPVFQPDTLKKEEEQARLRELAPEVIIVVAYGKLLPKINAYLAQDGIGDKVVAAHKAGNSYDFELEGTAVSLAEADVLTEPIQKAGFVSQTEKETAVVLDTNLTDELVDEGFVRELVSKIQVMRKEAGFEVTDRIALTYACVGRAKDVLSRFGDAIAQDVLAVSVSDAAPAGYVKEWDVNGEKVTLGVEKK